MFGLLKKNNDNQIVLTNLLSFGCSSTINSITIDWDIQNNDLVKQLGIEKIVFRNESTLVTKIVLIEEKIVEFHFLPQQRKYSITINGVDNDNKPCCESTKIVCDMVFVPSLTITNTTLYIGPEHKIGPWLMETPGDWLWTQTNFKSNPKLFIEIFKYALFPLPSESGQYIPIINPVNRYCIDLRENVNWRSSKKVKKYSKEFKISVNYNFKSAFEAASKFHKQYHRSTWITNSLIDFFSEMANDPNCPIKQRAFELWDKDNNLVAVVLGFGLGCVWHDYTMCAFLRDQRSCGSILTKTVGDLLQKCGYKIWYWGLKVDYMAEYDGKGGRYFDRQEFWDVWSKGMKETPIDVHQFVQQGNSIVSPKEI
eukprot:c19573_g1_i1.p1 GENE.c19573_g1_i1~~c19573_g1_i1.p1  ORF type:complete len:386 (+),score=132.00 c19573_g1_i1:56-1159(+)